MRKTLNNLLKQFSRPFVLRRPFFWIFSSPPTRTVETPYIHAHSAKPILNQNKLTNLTRYVSLSRVSSYPIRSPTATLYQKKPTRVLEDFGSSFLPEVRPHHLRFVSASTSCDLIIFFARNFVKFVKRVYSRGTCVRGGLRRIDFILTWILSSLSSVQT